MKENKTENHLSLETHDNSIGLELGKHISMLHRHGRCYIDRKMSSYEVGSGQYSFLFYLYNHNGSSQDEISRALGMDKTTTTRSIQKLEEKGFVERKRDKDDRRINRVFLTDAGFKIKKELKQFAKEWENILLENLDSNEILLLENLIYKLSENARAYRNTLCKKGD